MSLARVTAAYYLTRWRIDPTRARVGVRRDGDRWRVTICEVGRDTGVTTHDVSPARALVRAFQLAELAGLAGVDRHMCNAYEHPHGALSTRATRHTSRGCS